MSARPDFRWRLVFGLTLGIGIAVGLAIVLLDRILGISFPPILGGVLSAVLIVIVLLARKPEEKND